MGARIHGVEGGQSSKPNQVKMLTTARKAIKTVQLTAVASFVYVRHRTSLSRDASA